MDNKFYLSKKQKALYLGALALMLVPFQNCDISRPRVENASYRTVSSFAALNSDPASSITVSSQAPQYYDLETKTLGAGKQPIVKIVQSGDVTIPMTMNHSAREVAAYGKQSCTLCHQGDAGSSSNGPTTYANARFHRSIYNAGLEQPKTCSGCHNSSWSANPTGNNTSFLGENSIPLGFVGSKLSKYFNDSGQKNPVMMHDALVWDLDPQSKLATRTKTPIFAPTTECIVCHELPTSYTEFSAKGWSGASYHARLQDYLNTTQPQSPQQKASCLDCHTTDRPTTFSSTSSAFGDLAVGPLSGFKTTFGHMTAVTKEVLDPTTSVKSTSLTKPGMAGCQNCHALGATPGSRSWADGRFHSGASKLGAFLPTSTANPQALAECSSCHNAEAPTVWKTTSSKLPFSDSHGRNFAGVNIALTGGGTLHLTKDCSSCHQPTNPTNLTTDKPLWTSTKSFHSQIPADKRQLTSSYGSCRSCHDSQTKNIYFTVNGDGSTTKVAAGTAGAVAHATTSPYSSGECINCHTGTIKSSFSSLNDWAGAMTMSNSGFVTKALQYDNGTTTPLAGSVTIEMNHGASLFDTAAFASLRDNSGQLKCTSCHNNSTDPADSIGSNMYVGQFHWSLQNLKLTQPTTGCIDCHNTSLPSKKLFTSKFDHSAQVVSTTSKSNVSVSSIDCASCHTTLGTQIKHTNANKAADTTAFQYAGFHAGLGTLYTPGACTQCHSQDKPSTLGLRKNNATYKTLANAQLFTHSLSTAECSSCHTGGTYAGPASWYKEASTITVSFHNKQMTSTSCSTCHVAPTGTVTDGKTSYSHGSVDTNCESCHNSTVKAVELATTTTRDPSLWAGAMSMSNTGFVTKALQYDNGTTTPLAGSITLQMNHDASLFASTAFASLKDTSGKLKCASCHNNTTDPADSIGGNMFVGQFHWSLQNLKLTQPSTGCMDCHNSALPSKKLFTSKFDHSAQVVSTATNANVSVSTIDCASCHSPLDTQVKHTNANKTADTNAFKFAGFHAGLGTQYTPGACTQCHSQDKPTTLGLRKNNATYKTLANAQLFTHSMSTAECSSCHTGGTYAGPASWYKEGSTITVSFHNKLMTSNSCSTCHVAPTGSVTDGKATYTHTTNDKTCESCHSTTASAIAIATTATSDPSLWAGGAGRPHAVSGATSGTNCADCHGFNKTGSSVHLTVAESSHYGGVSNGNTCTTCHKDYTAFKGSISYLAYPHTNATANSGGCIACHSFKSSNYTALTPTAKFNTTTLSTFSQTISVKATRNADTNAPKAGRTFPTTHEITKDTIMNNCGACHRYSATTTSTTNIWQWVHDPSSPGLTHSKSSAGCNLCH